MKESLRIPNEADFEIVFNRLRDAKIIMSQTDLGKILGVGRAAVSYVAQKRGKTPPEWVRRFEDAGYCWRWVATGEGPMYNPNSISAQGRLVVANRIQDFADGKAVFSERDMELPLHTNYLNVIGASDTGSVHYFVIQGDSMEPAMKQGDICLVDTSKTTMDTGQYFLFSFGGHALGVRKVIINGNGIELLYDNKEYPTAKFDKGMTSVIGRVVGILKKM